MFASMTENMSFFKVQYVGPGHLLSDAPNKKSRITLYNVVSANCC